VATPSPGGSLTSRALILIAVFALLVLALSVPVRGWLSQRAEVTALRADITASSERIAELQTELDRWSDPAFISTEARRRLHFVLPGEIGYVTISTDGRPRHPSCTEVPRTEVLLSSCASGWTHRRGSGMRRASTRSYSTRCARRGISLSVR
jgi:cell division protein FtsB